MIEIRDLRFAYPDRAFSLAVDSLKIEEGERFRVSGPSGSGKTTLINIISGILKPDSGLVRVGGREITRRNDREIRRFRLERMGFIFQNFDLLEYLTVEQNILLPLIVAGRKPDAATRERLGSLIEAVGLAGKRRSHPGRLSQGERQRAAICRAVINDPCLLIADEPTASLDRKNAERFIELVSRVLEQTGATFLMVTHDTSCAGFFDRHLDMESLESNGKGEAHV